MSRITLKIEDKVLRELRRRAARQTRTLHDVANELLRTALRPARRAPYRFALRPWRRSCNRE
jgi:plasmid stability protein